MKVQKPKTQKQIDSLSKRRVESYVRHHRKEVESFACIPFGYGMRAYSKLKHSSDKSTEIRGKLEEMNKEYNISENLLREAVDEGILS